MLTDYYSILLSLFVVWTLLLLTPGPDFILMLRNTLSYGYRAGLITGIGITLAISMHVLIAISGIYALSKDSTIYTIVQISGAIYLIYLGVSALLKKKIETYLKNTKHIDSVKRKYEYLKQGFFCNIFNPKAPILMFGIFSQLIPYSATLMQKIFFSLEIIVINLVIWSLFSKFISSSIIEEKLNKYTNSVSFVSNIVLICLGAYVIIYNYAM